MFSSWVISIVGVVLLSLIADIMLPEGQLNKYIKSIFAIITVFVIVSPLPTIFSNFEQQADDFFIPNEEFVLNEDFLEELRFEKQREKENLLKVVFEQNGFKNVGISVVCDNQSVVFEIKTICLDIKKVVIQNEDKNIDIKDQLCKLVYSSVGINASEVIFYE